MSTAATADRQIVPPDSPLYDEARLAALRDTLAIVGARENAFDGQARVASAALHVPIALVNFVSDIGGDVRGRSGVDRCVAMHPDLGWEDSICKYVVASGDALFIPDTATHPLSSHSRARDLLGMAAYLGVPLTTKDGYTLGAFCVLDHSPREWTVEQVTLLEDLAQSVMSEVELLAQRRALETSRLTFRAVAESAREAIIATDETGRLTFWNDGARDTFGWTQDEMLGQPLSAIVAPESLVLHHEELALLLATAGQNPVGRTLELLGVRRDGSEFPLEIALRAWTRFGHTALCGVMRDLSHLQRAREMEETLLREREFFAAVLENMAEGVVACDANGRLSLFNRATREFHGLSESDAPIAEWAHTYALYDASGTRLLEPAEIPLVRALNGELLDGVEIVIAPRGLPRRILRCSGRRITGRDGQLLGAAVAMHDVTASRAADVAIRESEERFRSMFHQAGVAMGLVDDDGVLLEVNAAYAAFFGTTPTALVGRRVSEMSPPEEREVTRGPVRKLMSGEIDSAMLEKRFYRADGALRWGTLSISRLALTDGTSGILGIVQDITDRKAAEAERDRLIDVLREARAQAESANRAKSDLLSRASHELRTPLNSVIGFAGILQKNRSGHLTTEELAFVDRIGRNGKHLLRLVNDLLDLSKIESGKVDIELSPVSLFDLLYDVREALASRASEFGLVLTVDIPMDTVGADYTIIADEQKLRQILLNLAGNAVKYTPAGAVELRLVTNERGAPTRIDISDTGPGIGAQEIESIFEPFTVGHATAQGDVSTGLGLAITRSLCTVLGYRLTVESVVGSGTCFSVHLLPA